MISTMGIFKADSNGPEPLEALERAQDDLAGRQDRLERAFKGLELEWSNSLDKLNRIMGRLNARARAARDQDENDSASPPVSVPGFNLLEAQRELARRKAQGQNGVLRREG